MGAVISWFVEWISLSFQSLHTQNFASSHDVKSTGEGVAVYCASNRVPAASGARRFREDFTTVLRVPDARPARFVLCVERYAFEMDTPAEHLEISFIGTLLRQAGESLRLQCVHVCMSNALDESCAKKFREFRKELTAQQSWDSITLDFSNIEGDADLPSWLFSEKVPRKLALHN